MNINIKKITPDEVVAQTISWALVGGSHYICFANVHMLMEAYDSPDFSKMVNGADLVLPDGMPLVWMMRLKGAKQQPRVYGPTLMLQVLEAAAKRNIPVGFYGGSPDVLKTLLAQMQENLPALSIPYAYSPPFRPLGPREQAEITQDINRSGVRILFIGLGCPKQEIWMSKHRGKVNAVMLGVGAAFDFHAGAKSQSPVWLQNMGLEWLFRLLTEPRRLWKRYLYHNSRFIFLAIADLLGFLR